MGKIKVLLNKPRNGDLHGQTSALRNWLSVDFKIFCVRSGVHRDFSIPNLPPNKALT